MKTSDITDVEVCIAVEKTRLETWSGGFAYDVLMIKYQCPYKVAYAAMERAADRDLIEYGVSLRTAWATEKGLELIKNATR